MSLLSDGLEVLAIETHSFTLHFRILNSPTPEVPSSLKLCKDARLALVGKKVNQAKYQRLRFIEIILSEVPWRRSPGLRETIVEPLWIGQCPARILNNSQCRLPFPFVGQRKAKTVVLPDPCFVVLAPFHCAQDRVDKFRYRLFAEAEVFTNFGDKRHYNTPNWSTCPSRPCVETAPVEWSEQISRSRGR